MQRWPHVDRDLRRRLLSEIRRRQHREAAKLSAAQRIAKVDALVAFARAQTGERGPGSDESIELWLRLKARFRGVGG